jgi:hypothetical protein
VARMLMGTIPRRMKNTIIRETIQSTGSGVRNYTEEKNCDSLKENKKNQIFLFQPGQSEREKRDVI